MMSCYQLIKTIQIRETNKPSIERWMILKRRYECWKRSSLLNKVHLGARKMAHMVQLQAWRVQMAI